MKVSSEGKRAFVAVGSNLGDKVANCRKAIFLVSRHEGVLFKRCSGFYETPPVGISSNNWFINAVFEVQTTYSPLDFLEMLLQVERQMGRDRAAGPDRIIDLDLLDVEGVSRQPDAVSNLELPHPRFAERDFVLVPWAEIAPDVVPAGYTATVGQLLHRLHIDSSSIKKVEDF